MRECPRRGDDSTSPSTASQALNLLFGDYRLGGCGHLEVNEHGYSASVAAEKRSVFVIKNDVDAPIHADPLPPSGRILAVIEVLKHTLRAYNEISFASRFGTQRDVALLLVAVRDR